MGRITVTRIHELNSNAVAAADVHYAIFRLKEIPSMYRAFAHAFRAAVAGGKMAVSITSASDVSLGLRITKAVLIKNTSRMIDWYK